MILEGHAPKTLMTPSERLSDFVMMAVFRKTIHLSGCRVIDPNSIHWVTGISWG